MRRKKRSEKEFLFFFTWSWTATQSETCFSRRRTVNRRTTRFPGPAWLSSEKNSFFDVQKFVVFFSPFPFWFGLLVRNKLKREEDTQHKKRERTDSDQISVELVIFFFFFRLFEFAATIWLYYTSDKCVFSIRNSTHFFILLSTWNKKGKTEICLNYSLHSSERKNLKI
jgi:hypothetical protein